MVPRYWRVGEFAICDIAITIGKGRWATIILIHEIVMIYICFVGLSFLKGTSTWSKWDSDSIKWNADIIKWNASRVKWNVDNVNVKWILARV